jgi:hypothetical protein
MCEELIKTNHDFLVTETTLDPKLPVDAVVKVFRERKTTGQLTFHLSQGGVQKIALVEKTKADEEQSEKIRDILDME